MIGVIGGTCEAAFNYLRTRDIRWLRNQSDVTMCERDTRVRAILLVQFAHENRVSLSSDCELPQILV